MATTLDLGRIEQARARTHKLDRPSWFPLAVFGLLILLISPLYTSGRPPWGPQTGSSGISRHLPWLPGLSTSTEPWFPSLTWIIGLVAAGAASLAYYRHRARRVGVASPILPALAAGGLVLAVLVVASPAAAEATGWHWPFEKIVGWAPDLMVRSTTPLFCVAVVVAGLAFLERSLALAAFAAAFAGLVLFVSLYDVENLFYRIHLNVAAPTINLVLPGVALICAALVSGVTREVP